MTATMMAGPLLFISLTFISSISIVQANSFKVGWLKGYSEQFDLASFKRHGDDLTDATTSLRRSLQQVPIPPTRQCGQVLGSPTPKEVIAQLVNSFSALLGNVTLDQTVQYDVQAIVLCGSCQSVATQELLADDTDLAGFGYYCREGGYGYNVTTSGVLFLPIDPETGEIIANKKLKGSIFAHSLMTDTTDAPSEIMPENLTAFIEESPDPSVALGAIFSVAGGILSASTGVVSVVPDYVGFGQSQEMTKR